MEGQPRTVRRADARDNRARILAATRAAVAVDGLDVGVREVARRAEVGVATVYRHFPTKDALLAAAVAGPTSSCARVVEAGVADADPWRGLTRAVEELMVGQARDRTAGDSRDPGAAPARTDGPDAPDARAERDRALLLLTDLVRRAKRGGRLRADVGVEDLVLVMSAARAMPVADPGGRMAAARRLAGLVLASFRADPTSTPLPPAVRLPLPAPLPPSGADGARGAAGAAL